MARLSSVTFIVFGNSDLNKSTNVGGALFGSDGGLDIVGAASEAVTFGADIHLLAATVAAENPKAQQPRIRKRISGSKLATVSSPDIPNTAEQQAAHIIDLAAPMLNFPLRASASAPKATTRHVMGLPRNDSNSEGVRIF